MFSRALYVLTVVPHRVGEWIIHDKGDAMLSAQFFFLLHALRENNFVIDKDAVRSYYSHPGTFPHDSHTLSERLPSYKNQTMKNKCKYSFWRNQIPTQEPFCAFLPTYTILIRTVL